MPDRNKILITAAGGQLGRLVLAQLLDVVPASQIVAGVRNPDALQDFAAKGVEVRKADYDDPASLDAAFEGVDKVLLISSNAIGQRASQHANAIDAATRAKVSLIAYTSVLEADTNPMGLAAEHRDAEARIRASGLPFTFLRNGWYTENYTANIAAVLQHGAVVGSARDGKISSAPRSDFAAAAVAVLTSSASQAGKVYELAGDEGYTLAEYAATIAAQSGKPVVYQDLPEEAYKGILLQVGLPEPLADMLVETDNKAAKGALFNDSRDLSRLIGRPTKTIDASVGEALAN